MVSLPLMIVPEVSRKRRWVVSGVAKQQTVEHLAVTMLNHELRLFPAKWYPRLREYEKAP
jgi:hypothetical protein